MSPTGLRGWRRLVHTPGSAGRVKETLESLAHLPLSFNNRKRGTGHRCCNGQSGQSRAPGEDGNPHSRLFERNHGVHVPPANSLAIGVARTHNFPDEFQRLPNRETD